MMLLLSLIHIYRAVYGELVQFDTGVHGIVLDLKRDSVGVVPVSYTHLPHG